MKWLKFLIAALVVTAGAMLCNNTLDNDSWYVLAEGREIVQNGLYFEDQLSMHEGLEVTVQNYGFAVIFYLIYTAFGPIGIYVSMLILNLILCFLVYRVCMVLSKGKMNISLLIAVLMDLLLANWFIVTRAQMVSYVLLMFLIYLLELYISTKNNKYLWWIPVLSLLQVNLHASLWPMMIIVLIVYIIDSIKQPKLHLEGYNTKPLIVVLFVTLLVGFLNPYGYKMLTFIMTSYGVAEAQAKIIELQAFRPFESFYTVILSGTIILTVLVYIYAKNDKLRMRWLIMIFGFLALGVNTTKGMSHLILVLLIPLVLIIKDYRIKNRKIVLLIGTFIGIISLSTIVAVSVIATSQMIDGPSEQVIAAIDRLDLIVGKEKEAVKVYSGFDHGGYLEYRGYKPYLDPRMEVFLKKNNGKEDIFKEWYDLENGDINKDVFLNKYDFDYLVTLDSEKLYSLDGEEYEMIFENNDDTGIRIWQKKKGLESRP